MDHINNSYKWSLISKDKDMIIKSLKSDGKDYGIYAFEEHLDKRTLESNGLRDGIIIKATPGSLRSLKKRKFALINCFYLNLITYKKWIMFLKVKSQNQYLI